MLETEAKVDLKVKAGSLCQCCPYGFHIDRDFVRYCASIYNSAQIDKLKQKKRERRKKHKTVESYLGLNNSCCLERKTGGPSLEGECQKFDEEKCICGLESVMLDFEDTWQKSLPKKAFHNTNVVSTSKNFSSGQTGASSFKLLRSNSDAHAKSRWTNSSNIFSENELLLQSTPKTDELQNIATTVAALSKEESCFCTVGIHQNVLKNIREQMATSLKRMKELEEQVKTIPLLQDKVSALKEDKKVLLHWLKKKYKESSVKLDRGAAENNIENINKTLHNDVPHFTNNHIGSCNITSSSEDLSSPALASNLDAVLTKISFVDNEIISQLSLDIDKAFFNGVAKEEKFFKNIGTLCSVLTRDVGVGHIPSKSKSIGVGDGNVFSVLNCVHCIKDSGMKQFVNISSESLGSESDSADDIHRKTFDSKVCDRVLNFDVCVMPPIQSSCNSSGIFISENNKENALKLELNKYVKPTSRSSKHIPEVPITRFKDAGVNTVKQNKCTSTMTDLVFSDSVFEKLLNQSKVLRSNKGTWCDYPKKLVKSTQICIAKPKTYDASTIYDVKMYCHHVSTQTTLMANSSLDKGKEMHTTGTGDNHICNYSCIKDGSKCINSAQTKNSHITNSHDQYQNTLSVGCGSSTVSTVLCDKCVHIQLKTVGVGDIDVHEPFCLQCMDAVITYEVKDKPIIVNSIGVNTSLDSVNSINYSSNDIHICDKCSATIQSVAQNFAAQSKETCDMPDSASRIPKLNIFSSMDKGSFLCQPKCVQVKKTVLSDKKNLDSVSNNAKRESLSGPVKDSPKSVRKNPCEQTSSETIIVLDEHSSESCLKDETKKIENIETNLNPFKVISHKRTELSKEVNAACKVFNDYLQKPDRSSEKKILTSLNIIQQEWFEVANQKKANPHIIEDYLDAFEEFSKPFLHRIVNLADSNGNTAIHYAVSYSNFDVVSILIDSKVCDVNKQNKAGYTCIMLVALADIKSDAHQYVVHRLFSMGDINTKATQNGQTALMLAVSHGKIDIVKMLVEAGAEINLQDNDGSTALMCASEHGRSDIVRFFLSHPECDPNIMDSDGSNALMIAMEAGHKDIGLLIYATMNFSRGSSPYSSLKQRRRSTPRSTPPSRTPTLRTPPPPSPSARSTSSLPSTFHFMN